MPDPKKPWEKNYSEDIVETKVEAKKPWEQEYDVSESEKKKSTPTTTPPKSVSGTPTGSSGGVNPAFKNTIPSPIPDFNNLPKSKEVPIKVGGETSFLEDVVSTVKSKANKLATGSSQLGADIAAIPELLYDTAAIPQNAIADYFDLPNLHADSDKFKKNIGIRNAVKELYQGEVVKLREHAKQVDTKYQDGIYDSFKNGDLLGGFDQITNSFVESLPATASIMLGGAYAKAPQLLTASTMVFGSGKNERLKDENPEMNTNARTINALGTGFAEGTFETMGSGSIGAAARGLIERQGAAKATTILKDGLVKSYKYALSKNPFTASLAVEGVEEWATQVTQNSIDVATGVKPKDFNVFDGAADAFIGGAFGGAVFGGGLKGIEQMTNLQDRNAIKTNIKNTQELQKALENPDISEETKLQIEKTIEGLVKTNQQLIIKNTKHADNLHPKLKEQLVESVTKIEETKQAVKSIKLDGTTNDAQKQILLDGLKEDFKKHIKLKADILEGKSTPVDVLPLKEQDKIKRQALKELTTEQNPDGTKSIEIDNAQIVERANKIYKKQEELVASQESLIDSATLPTIPENYNIVDTPVVNSNEKTLEEKSKDFDLFHTGAEGMSIESVSVDPRVTRQGRKGKYGGFYTYDNIKNIIDFVKGNATTSVYGIKLNDGVEITDYNGSIERLDAEKLQELRDSGIKVIRGKSLVGKTEIIVVDKSAIKNITKINDTKQNSPTPEAQPQAEVPQQAEADKVVEQAVINNDEIATKNNNKVNDVNALSNGSNQEVSPVEDVVAPSVENVTEIIGATTPFPNDAKVGDKLISKMIPNEKGNLFEYKMVNPFKTDYTEKWEDYDKIVALPSTQAYIEKYKNGEIPPPIQVIKRNDGEFTSLNRRRIVAAREAGIKEIPAWVEIKNNEKLQEGDITPNASIRPTATNVGESGNTKQESPVQESVSSSVDGGEVKGDASVGKNADSTDLANDKGVSVTTKQGKSRPVTDLDIAKSNLKFALIARNEASEYLKTTGKNPFADKVTYNKAKLADAKRRIKSLNAEIDKLTNIKEVVSESPKVLYQYKGVDVVKEEDLTTKSGVKYKKITFVDGKNTTLTESAFNSFKKEQIELDSEGVNEGVKPNNEGVKKPPTTKERIAERIKLSDAKIDEKSDAVKAKLKAFSDMFPSADINPDDYKTNGFSTDAIIDMVAKAAKSLMEAGIRMDEAIKQAIEGYNAHFDDKIDPKVIEENIRKEATDNEKSNPKKEADNDFKREKGKSSVLKRIREGGNSSEINDIIDKIGLNYEGRKQEQVYADGVNFVKEVGIAEAYNAIKNGELKDSDTINVVYATILQEFPKMAENEISKVSDPQELSDLIKELDDFHEKIYTEFKTRTIDAGRGSAILNFIYNQDLKIRYSLSQQIENFKKVNNGVVPPEALAKMKELDKQYQEANKRIEELEGLLKEAQEQKDFENIVEEEKRQPKLSKTKREKAEKIIKALDDFEKSILKNSYSDATMITPIIVQGIRATKLAIKQGVNIAEAIEKGIDGIKKELEKLGKTFDNEERFRNDLNKSLDGIDVELQQPKVTVDKNGKVRIPTEMIKYYISKGGTDLSEFAKQVQESIKDEFPDVTVRDIRESVANYGKKANKSRPQIVEDIQKLKSEERLRLEFEDLQNRISKEKNEVKKRALTQTQKRLKEQIKQLQDDLGVTETERTNRSVNYTKKRIEILREKIKNNDFAKKETKPIVESQELKEAKIEKNRVQEEFDYLSYKQELDNRTFEDKALQLGSDLWDAQRLTLATGEASFVGAQGGLYMVDATFSRKTLKNLVENFKGTTAKEWKSNPFGTALKMIKSASSAGAIIKMVNTMGTANNYIDSQRLLKESPDYDLYLKMGIRLLGEDVKTQVQDDNFIGNNILTLLKLPINFIDRVEKADLKNFKITLAETEKKRTTLQGYYEKLKTGKVSDKNKKTATEIFSNANPLATFERGNNTFMNFARKDLADIYIAELRAQGKNPIDHLDDFKKVGSAINTITGSGNLNQTVTMALPILNKTMFSARYFAASWNLTPPMSLYYLAKLGNYDGMEINKPGTWKTWKPTVAQKAFVKPMMKGFLAMYGVSLATMALINAAIDDDDEMTEEEKAKKRAYIEYDPRSSNFMQVNSGNTHTDFFGPYRGNVVFMSKILSGQSKNREGKIIENGSEYGSRTDFQIGAEYLAGKANPTLGVPLRYWQGSFKDVVNEETGEKERKRMLFNDEVGIGYQIKHNTYPIFIKTVKAISDEDPVLGSAFYNTLAFFGKNTNVYKTPKAATPEQEFLKDQEKKKSLYKLPENEKVKIRVDRKLTRVESDVKLLQNLQTAQQKGLPYFISMDAALTKQQVKDMDLSGTDESVARIKQIVSEVKAQYGIEDEE